MSVFYSPLCWMLFASFALWAYLVWTICRQRAVGVKNQETEDRSYLPTITSGPYVASVYLLAWLLFAFVSTPFGSQLLRQSLVQDSSADAMFAPEYILVASMGYLMTNDPATSVLNDGTALRVAEAARWHREHPEAYLVM